MEHFYSEADTLRKEEISGDLYFTERGNFKGFTLYGKRKKTYNTFMRRKIYQQLLDWKNNRKGRTALLIEGARRTGKSYIVEEFARNEYKSYIMVNFGHISREVKAVFHNYLSDTPLFLQNLSIATRTRLYERDSLIIFDEVQNYPAAREAIKFLVEDGRYDYIETGSLISIHDNVKDIIIPSEEEKINIYPMDFEEFCWALGDEVTVPYIRECFAKRKPLGQILHRSTMQLFRQYMVVGGMPRVVKAYAETKDFNKVEFEKKLIIGLYREDIGKKTNRNRKKVMAVFNSIPSELAHHDKVFTLSTIDPNGKVLNYEDSFYWLEDSMISNICYNTTEPKVGLNINTDRTTLKCYMGDTGLLVSMAIGEHDFIESEIYRSLLADKLHVNEGMFAENVVAQILRANGHTLFFHAFYDETRKNRYEVDFLIRNGKRISPIEVKSSNTKQHSSLDRLIEKQHAYLGSKYIINTKDYKEEDGITFIPLYMAICL